MNQEDPLERLVAAVQASPKYRAIIPGLIRHIGAGELGKRQNYKEALKATKSKLHQAGGAYQEGPIAYQSWLERLISIRGDPSGHQLRNLCKQMMAAHASTRERLPVIDSFHRQILSDEAPVHSVLDVACGLHPLSIPWMPLAKQATYIACDIYTDLVIFLDAFFTQMNVDGRAFPCDLTAEIPEEPVQVAFLLKTLPCLEQIEKEISLRLLDQIRADILLVSFPAHSLGGKAKGMPENYATRFSQLLASRSWPWKRYDFEVEVLFKVYKSAGKMQDIGCA